MRSRSVADSVTYAAASSFAASSSPPPPPSSAAASTAGSSRHALNRAEGTLSFDLLASEPGRRLRVLWLENRLECSLWSYYCELRDAMAQLHELCTPSPSRTCLGEGFAPDVAIAGPRFSINIPTPNETLGFARSRLNQLPLLIIVRHPSAPAALPHLLRRAHLAPHASRLTPHAPRLTEPPPAAVPPRVPGSKTSCTRPRAGGRSWAAWTPSSHGPRPPVPWVPLLGSIPAGAVTSRGVREWRTTGCRLPLTPPSLLGTRPRRRGCRSPSMWASPVRAASTSTHSARPCSRPFVRVRRTATTQQTATPSPLHSTAMHALYTRIAHTLAAGHRAVTPPRVAAGHLRRRLPPPRSERQRLPGHVDADDAQPQE